jgi:hypothetical protein
MFIVLLLFSIYKSSGRRGRDRMLVGFTPMQSVPITANVVSSNPAQAEVYSIMC